MQQFHLNLSFVLLLVCIYLSSANGQSFPQIPGNFTVKQINWFWPNGHFSLGPMSYDLPNNRVRLDYNITGGKYTQLNIYGKNEGIIYSIYNVTGKAPTCGKMHLWGPFTGKFQMLFIQNFDHFFNLNEN